MLIKMNSTHTLMSTAAAKITSLIQHHLPVVQVTQLMRITSHHNCTICHHDNGVTLVVVPVRNIHNLVDYSNVAAAVVPVKETVRQHLNLLTFEITHSKQPPLR